MSLGVTNWIDNGILNNVRLHLNLPIFPLFGLAGVQLFWSLFFSLIHLCTLRYNCTLMRETFRFIFTQDGLWLAGDVNTILISFFFNLFWSLGPKISTCGNFIKILVFLVLLWLLLFDLLMFRKYSVVSITWENVN